MLEIGHKYAKNGEEYRDFGLSNILFSHRHKGLGEIGNTLLKGHYNLFWAFHSFPNMEAVGLAASIIAIVDIAKKLKDVIAHLVGKVCIYFRAQDFNCMAEILDRFQSQRSTRPL